MGLGCYFAASNKDRKLAFFKRLFGQVGVYADEVTIKNVTIAKPGNTEPHLRIEDTCGNTTFFRPGQRTVRFEHKGNSVSVFFSKYGPLAVFKRAKSNSKIKISPLRDFPEKPLKEDIVDPAEEFKHTLASKVYDFLSHKKIE